MTELPTVAARPAPYTALGPAQRADLVMRQIVSLEQARCNQEIQIAMGEATRDLAEQRGESMEAHTAQIEGARKQIATLDAALTRLRADHAHLIEEARAAAG